MLGVQDRASGALVGRVGVQFHRAWPHEDPEVGWAFDPDWWGRGLATESGAAAVAWGHEQLGFRRLVSITVEENVRSRRVMARLGFSLLTTVTEEATGLELWVHSHETGRRPS
jgi:RimJ/RimL family protein N-acetyltransferase